MCGNYRVRDARANIREAAPDVIQKVRILTISPPIPNDTLSFGPDFPADVRAQIEQALVAFSQTEDWSASIGSADFYDWTGLTPTTDAEYDFVRSMVAATGLTLEDSRTVTRATRSTGPAPAAGRGPSSISLHDADPGATDALASAT